MDRNIKNLKNGQYYHVIIKYKQTTVGYNLKNVLLV